MKINLHASTFFLLAIVLLASCNEPKPITQSNTTTALPAYDPYFIPSSDTVSQYGPKCITRDLLQDKNGTFWFATWHGIISYDGKVFTNHTLKNNLAKFHMLDVFEDSKGNVWFTMAGGGVYRYDGKMFTRFTSLDGLVADYVICIAEDRNGSIWFGTEHGVSWYDGTVFTSVKGMEGNYISAILQDKTGLMRFGSNKGFFTFDAQRKTLQPFAKADSLMNVTALYEDGTGKIWIGKMNGLSVYDPATASIHPNALNDTLPARLTYYISSDKKGNVLLAHSEASDQHPNYPTQILFCYDGKSFTRIAEKGEPDDFQIFGNMEDNAGNIWFGTMKGPCRYDGKSVTHFYQ